MSGLDSLVLAAYMLLTLGMSAAFVRGQHSVDDYFVGGRSLPWWALAISIVATQSSANSFIGIPAYVALVPGGGLHWLQYELAVPLAMVLVMLVLTPVLRGLGLISVYEYLEQRFDRATRLAMSAVFLLSRGLATGVALYAAALVVQACTGWPLGVAVMVTGVMVVVYDTLGGMRAVVWTDVLQMAVLLLGLGWCVAVALDLAGGWAAALGALPPERLQALQGGHGLGDGARAPLWGFLAGGLVLYAAYYGVDQSQVQRQLAAPDVASARRALLLNGLARFPLTLAYIALGVAVGAVYLADPALQAAVPARQLDRLVPEFIIMHLPDGVRGLLVAALLAAAMSSLDSALNGMSAATMRDFVDPWLKAHPGHSPARTERRRLWLGRAATVVWGALIIVFALWVGDLSSSVVEGINRVGALFYGPLLAAFVCGILDRRARGPAVLAGVVLGLACNLALEAWLGPRLFWMWWNLSGLLVAVLVAWAGSRCLAPPRPEQLRGTTLDAAALRQAWAQSRRMAWLLLGWSGLILAVMGALTLAPWRA